MHFREGDNRACLSRAAGKFALGASSLALITALGLCSAAAQTQTAATNTGPIETVTVTAQYVSQNVQNTPLAISVVTAADLDMRGITNLGQLGTTVPGLTLSPAPAAFGNGIQTYIRGVGQYDTAFASEPGVGMYVDDVYFGTMTGSEMALLDLNRVEVLKGPQGVLGGKNDIGGAIKLFTQQPTDDNSGYFEATYGAFDDIEVRGAANFTLVPGHVFLRVSGFSKNQNGYVNEMDYACLYGPGTNASGPGSAGSLPVTTQNNGCKIGTQGGYDEAGGRVQVKFVLDSHLQDNISVDVIRDNSELTPDVLYAVDPDGTNVYYNNGKGVQSVPRNTFIGAAVGGAANVPATDIPLWNIDYNIPRYGIPYDQRFIPNGKQIYTTTYATYSTQFGQNYTDGELLHSWSVTNTLDYDLPWDIHFKSITGYRYYNGAYSNDSDVSPMSFELTTTFPTDREFQQEERFTGTLLDNKLEWTAGAFYYNRTNRATGPVQLDVDYDEGVFLGIPALQALEFEQNDTYRAENTSGYVYGIYHIWDNWEVLGGFRYTSESKTYYFDHIDPVPGVPGSGFFRDAANPACDYLPFTTTCPQNAPLAANTVTTSRPDYRAGTDYHFTDSLMAYFTWSTGYRSGGFNSRPFDPFQLEPGNGAKYGAEEIKSYEIGAKTQFFDDRLQFDIAAYNAIYDHTITPISKIDPSGLPWVFYTNAGQSVNRGLEIQSQAAPIDNLLLTLNYSYVHVSISAPTGVAGLPPGCLSAGSAPGSCADPISQFSPILFPAQTLQLAAQYTYKFGLGQITPRLEYDWQSVIYQDADSDPYTAVPARGLLNGSLTWDAPDNGWQIQLLVTNIADKKYFLDMFDLMTFGEGTVEAQPGPPREWFIQLKKAF